MRVELDDQIALLIAAARLFLNREPRTRHSAPTAYNRSIIASSVGSNSAITPSTEVKCIACIGDYGDSFTPQRAQSRTVKSVAGGNPNLRIETMPAKDCEPRLNPNPLNLHWNAGELAVAVQG
jgi:hypothetical protein